MDWLLIVSSLAVVGLNGWLIVLVYQMLKYLRQIARNTGDTYHAHAALTNYSTWMYKIGNWQLIESKLEPGFVAGDPPRRPGAYDGEILRRPGIRKPSTGSA